MRKILIIIALIFTFIVFQMIFGEFISSHPTYLIIFQGFVFFFLGVFYQRRLGKIINKWLYVFIIPVFIILVSILILDFSKTICLIVICPLSIHLGILSYNYKSFFLYISFNLILTLIFGFIIQPNIYSFLKNGGQRPINYFPKIEIKNENSENIIFGKGIVVLDLWTTSCGVCFKEFPDFNKLSKKYKSRVKFYSLNVPLRNDNFERSKKIMKNLNYDFKNLYCKEFKQVKDSLKVSSFPTLIILKDNKIQFLGRLSYDENVKYNSFESELNKILDN
jgi:thiol-disulfide isomerase/thioredoxin